MTQQQIEQAAIDWRGSSESAYTTDAFKAGAKWMADWFEKYLKTKSKMGSIEETLYIRYGEIPKNGKSAIWKGFKCVGYEGGVSVYEAHRNVDGIYAPVIPYPLTPTTLDDFVYHLMYFRGRKYLVRGDLLGYIGSNGEPLLENVEIVSELNDNKE